MAILSVAFCPTNSTTTVAAVAVVMDATQAVDPVSPTLHHIPILRLKSVLLSPHLPSTQLALRITFVFYLVRMRPLLLVSST